VPRGLGGERAAYGVEGGEASQAGGPGEIALGNSGHLGKGHLTLTLLARGH